MKSLVVDSMLRSFTSVSESSTVFEVIEKIAKSEKMMLLCVVDKEGRLAGVIPPRDVLELVVVRQFGRMRHPFFGPEVLHFLVAKNAAEVMSAPAYVRLDDDVEKAINIMLARGFYEVPVVDQESKVIGVIDYFSLVKGSLGYFKE